MSLAADPSDFGIRTTRPSPMRGSLRERLPSRFRTDLGDWRTLHVEQEAQQRYENALRGHSDPLDLARILLTIMASQDDWLVCCVRDIDQRPLEFATMVPGDVVARLRQIAIGDAVTADFIAWRP